MNRLILRPLFWMALLLVLLVPAGVAEAQGPSPGDRLVFGGSFTVHSGDTFDGSIVVFGGSASVEEGAIVNGDVAVIGGTASINGQILGDVAVIGGSLTLGATAVVEGDAVNFGGSLNRDPNAIIRGDTVSGFGTGEDGRAGIVVPGIPPVSIEPVVRTPANSFGDWLLRYFLRGLSALAWATVLAVLGVLILVFAPRPTERVRETATREPLISFVAGLLAVVLGLPVAVVLAITICLLPLSVVTVFALLAGWLFGWVALGWLVGQRLLSAFKMAQATPVLEMAVGVVALTLVWRLPLAVPFLGWFLFAGIGLVAGSISLGAALLSRFGTHTYSSGPAAGSGALIPPAPAPTPALPDPDLRQEDR